MTSGDASCSQPHWNTAGGSLWAEDKRSTSPRGALREVEIRLQKFWDRETNRHCLRAHQERRDALLLSSESCSEAESRSPLSDWRTKPSNHSPAQKPLFPGMAGRRKDWARSDLEGPEESAASTRHRSINESPSRAIRAATADIGDIDSRLQDLQKFLRAAKEGLQQTINS